MLQTLHFIFHPSAFILRTFVDLLQKHFDPFAGFGAGIQDEGQLRYPSQRKPVADFMAKKSRRRGQSLDTSLLLLQAPQNRDRDSGMMQVSGQFHARHGGEPDSRVFHLA